MCVVVTNLTNMEEEYFHPKTTPDVALRLAIRMSISIPGKKISSWKVVDISIEIIFVAKIDSKHEQILMVEPYLHVYIEATIIFSTNINENRVCAREFLFWFVGILLYL